MPTTHVRLQELSVARAGTPLVSRLNLTVSAGQCAVILGENGRGKSSLLAVLAGSLPPAGGSVQIHGSVAIAHQHMPAAALTIGDLTGQAIERSLAALSSLEEAIQLLVDETPDAYAVYESALATAEALNAWNAENRVNQALNALGAVTDRGRTLSSLSVGQRYRVRLACLLGGDHDILLLDEPTNHLDHEALRFLTDSIRAHKGVVIAVTHDRAVIRDIADTIVDLDPTPDGLPRVHGDGFDAFLERRSAMIKRWIQDHAAEQAHRADLVADLAQARERVDSAWRPPKGTGKHTRSSRAPGVVQALKRTQQALEESPLLIPEPPLSLSFPSLPARPGKILIKSSAFTVTERARFREPLEILSGDRIVITGPNGAGKSTVLSVLAGERTPDEGWVHTAARTGWLRQESLSERADRGAAVRFGLLNRAASRLRRSEMSMGQGRRLDLATVLAQDPELLLLDEPTNHLSMHLSAELTTALKETKAAVVIVTHDRQLLRDTADWQHIQLGD